MVESCERPKLHITQPCPSAHRSSSRHKGTTHHVQFDTQWFLVLCSSLSGDHQCFSDAREHPISRSWNLVAQQTAVKQGFIFYTRLSPHDAATLFLLRVPEYAFIIESIRPFPSSQPGGGKVECWPRTRKPTNTTKHLLWATTV